MLGKRESGEETIRQEGNKVRQEQSCVESFSRQEKKKSEVLVFHKNE
jgi:hypothetical protein